jgi:hypothetical protein
VTLTPASFATYFAFGANTGTAVGASITANANTLFVNTGTAAGSLAFTAKALYTVQFAYRGLTATATEAFSGCVVIDGIAITGATVGSPTTQTYASTGTLGVPGGLPVQFAVQTSYGDGTTRSTLTGVSFTSSVTSVLPNPNANGVATTVRPTTNTVTSVTDPTSGKVWTSAPFPVLVNTATCADLVVSPAGPLTLPESTVQPLSVACAFDDAQTFDVGGVVTSSSANPGVVTVGTSSSGTELVSQSVPASTSVTLGFGGQSVTLGVTVQ